MIYPKGTRITKTTKEALSIFITKVLATRPGLGKGVKILTNSSQNEPDQPYIILEKKSGREPYCQSDGIYKWHNYEMEYVIDIRVPETDMKKSDTPVNPMKIPNYNTGYGLVADLNDDISSDIADILMEVVELREGREILSSLGIYNVTLKHVGEQYSDVEYQNPLAITFECCVLI